MAAQWGRLRRLRACSVRSPRVSKADADIRGPHPSRIGSALALLAKMRSLLKSDGEHWSRYLKAAKIQPH